MPYPNITLMSIAPGPQGTQETLRIMAALAQKAKNWSVFKHFASMFTSAADVDKTLRNSYQYNEEPVETLFSPEFNLDHLLKYGFLIGDCDDIAMFYAAVFHAMGIPARFVAMRTRRNDPDYYHVVVEAGGTNGEWIRYDATVPPGLHQTDFGQMIIYV